MTFTRPVSVATALTVVVFTWCGWQVWHELQRQPPDHFPSSLQLALIVLVVSGAGSVAGVVLGAIGAAVARALSRNYGDAFKVGYFVGLNLTALTFPWWLPQLIQA